MRKITTILLLAILAVSCSPDNTEEGVVNVDLEGSWVLEDVSCFCYFEPDTDFSSHRISFAGSNLTVVNEGDYSFFSESGDFNYTVAGNLITMPDGAQYRYKIDNQQLQLIFVDDPLLADDEVSFIYYKK
mgnify:CR=1 FL=1